MVGFFLKEIAVCGLFFVLPSVHSFAFRPFCKAEGAIVLLQKDPVTGEVVRRHDDRARHLGDIREELVISGLRGADLFDDKDWFEGINPLSVSLSEQSRFLQESDETFYMRECFCPYRGEYQDAVYCPLDTGFCGVKRGSAYDGFPLGCFSSTRSSEFARNVFLVILVWFFMLFVCIFFTVPGRSCLSFFIGAGIPWWNRYHANRIMRQDPERAQYLIRRNLHYRRLVLERRLRTIAPEILATANENLAAIMQQQEQLHVEENKPVPTSLYLKTRIYKLEEPVEMAETGLENIEDEEDLDAMCIICFQGLADGDRVGALTCNHTFHVDCLKSWLKRRNVCPLCQCPDIAGPRFDRIPIEESAASEEGLSGTQAELPPANGVEE
jgi:hypothetical protein